MDGEWATWERRRVNSDVEDEKEDLEREVFVIWEGFSSGFGTKAFEETVVEDGFCWRDGRKKGGGEIAGADGGAAALIGRSKESMQYGRGAVEQAGGGTRS